MPGFKTIYSKEGFPLADFRSAVTRSWLLEDIGEAVFYIPVSSSKCKLEYLEFGNFVRVQHGDLPEWVGIIDTPRIWRNGYVEVHAFEPAYLLQYRYPPIDFTVTGTPGEKFSALLDQANTQFLTSIVEGNVSELGSSTEEKFSLNIYKHIHDLCYRFAMEWRTYPIIDTNGRLSVHMDFVSRVGIDTDAELIQGKNILYGDAPYEESGELVNYIDAMTEETDAPATLVSYGVPMPYGFRMKRDTFFGVLADSLPELAVNSVAKTRSASISAPLTVANVNGLFSNINVGNTLSYRYNNIGFNNGGLGVSNRIRIAGFRFDEVMGTCELFTENITT